MDTDNNTTTDSRRSIYITRHGQRADFLDADWPDKNPDCRHDPPLSDTGMDQAAELGAFCKHKGITRIICSPYIRCLQTAYGVIKAIHSSSNQSQLKICVEPGCQEFYDSAKVWTEDRMPQWYFYHDKKQSKPTYEAQLADILPFIDMTYVPLYTEDKYFLKRGEPNEGTFVELRSDLEVRLTKLFEHIMHDTDPQNQNVLFVTHAAGLVSSVETLMQKRHPDMRTGVCGLTTVLFDPETKTYELITNNDCSFLKLGEMHHWMYSKQTD